MSSIERTIQRNIIRTRCYKKDGNLKNFNKEWDKVYYKHHKDGSITTKTGVLVKGKKKDFFMKVKDLLSKIKTGKKN